MTSYITKPPLALCCLCWHESGRRERAVGCFSVGHWMLLVGGCHSPRVLILLFPVISAPRFLWSQHRFSNEPHIQDSKAPVVTSALRGTAATERQISRTPPMLVKAGHAYCCSELRLGIWKPSIRFVLFVSYWSILDVYFIMHAHFPFLYL